jgi:O-antigen ligase
LSSLSKRANWPSLFLFPAFFFALLTSVLASYLNYWCGVTSLLLLLCFRRTEKFSWSYLNIAVIAYIAVVICNLFFIDVAYTPEDFYYIAYFAIGFIVFSQLSLRQIIHIYKLLVYLFIFLSIWALIQYYIGDYYIVRAGLRSNTIFTTPNTFAAAINLILFPLIASNLSNKSKPLMFGVMLLLFYALLVTQSRGGWLSFFIGCFSITIFVYKNKLQKKVNWLRILLGLISVFVVFFISHAFDWQSNRKQTEFNLFEITRMEGLSEHANHRLVLYNAALDRIKEKPLLGHGYHNFQFYWLKDQKPPFRNSTTKFAHNDYLQIWMETGLFGLIAIISIIALFYYQIWNNYKHNNYNLLVFFLALIGGLSAYFAHAMVDFVISPCFLTLLFGAYLGTASQVLKPKDASDVYIKKIKNKIGQINLNIKFWRIFICLILIILLSQPYIAELAFKRAEKYTKQGEIEVALPYYELARRFAPYNAYYYALEGTYWRQAVRKTGYGKQSAQRADQLFANGAKANPFDVKNVLSRAVLNRDYPELLSTPASNDNILDWFDHILYWRPRLVAGQLEHVKTLYKFGQKKKAKEMLEKYIIINPDSDGLTNLKEELIF